MRDTLKSSRFDQEGYDRKPWNVSFTCHRLTHLAHFLKFLNLSEKFQFITSPVEPRTFSSPPPHNLKDVNVLFLLYVRQITWLHMKTMRLPTINSPPQQHHHQPDRLPQMHSLSGSTCKTAFGSVNNNLASDHPYLPVRCSKPASTPNGTVTSPPLLTFYRSSMNQLRVQQCALVASLVNKNSNAREQMLKRQLMKAVMNQQPGGLDYLYFLRKYAEDATSSNNSIRQEFDYLDYIRRDAAEEFQRNGVEVANLESFRITDSSRSLCVAKVSDSNQTASNTKDSYGQGRECLLKHVHDSAIISYGDFTTSMSNHEPQESNLETYISPKKSEKDFSVNGASRNRRNIFRNSRSHRRRRSTSRRRQESNERSRLRSSKNAVSTDASTTGRRQKRSKPYDGAGRPSAASCRNGKPEHWPSLKCESFCYRQLKKSQINNAVTSFL